ncbi:MAG: hypothetical protein KDB27_24745 [Planctomycetales bacterium]|nr:hypothetical protein [Planctomycetales bacterium]
MKSNLRVCRLTLAALLVGAVSAQANLVVEIGDGQAAIAPGVGTTTASFDIVFHNPMASGFDFSGYTLFLDIGPAGLGLPAGVSFAADPAVYLTGEGTAPLIGAGKNGTKNLTPAAGDIALGQAQFGFNGTIDAGESFTVIRINLDVDRSLATPGEHDLFLSPSAMSIFTNTAAESLPFTSTGGTLTLTAVPEPSALLYGGLAVALAGLWKCLRVLLGDAKHTFCGQPHFMMR